MAICNSHTRALIVKLLFVSLFLINWPVGADTSTSQHLRPNSTSTPSFDLPNVFRKLPILHEGRVKPLETYARHILLQMSGKSSYAGKPAIYQLTRILFRPEFAISDTIFLINNPDVAIALGIDTQKRGRFSFEQLEPHLDSLQNLAANADKIDKESRSVTDKEILSLFQNVSYYNTLSQAMVYSLPSPMFRVESAELAKRMSLPASENISFWTLMASVRILAEILAQVDPRDSVTRDSLSQEAISLSHRMYLFNRGLFPSPFRVIADSIVEGGWTSPSALLSDPKAQHRHSKELELLSQLLQSFRANDPQAFKLASQNLGELSFEHIDRARAFDIELIYQRVQPFFWSLVIYWFTLIMCFLYLLFNRNILRIAAAFLLIVGLIPHISGILTRMYLMGRPPVTNLYETFLWVSAVVILLSLFLEKQFRRGVGILAGAISGVLLLSVANRYAMDGDTLGVLVAVLDSNFWLSTHVVTITIGYSAGILAGVLGHIWIARAILPDRGTRKQNLIELNKMIYGVLCFALLFSFIGTVLGGIWADQSWGRFWGWDPKENGALMLVLWCIILLHTRQFGQIGPKGMAFGSVIGTIIVVLAWFGVNLLSIGLHSYGFTEGAAIKLFVYIGIELAYLAVGAALILKATNTTATTSD